ncbi:MAG: sigma-70 family RNA polymerase sigma factor [Acidobacteriota bacterium]
MSGTELTVLLRRWTAGDEEAGQRMLEALHAELRAQARIALRNERANHTLQPTALVNEAYLRLVEVDRIEWQDRRHFLCAAAKTMRRVLVDHARRRGRVKRGDGRALMPLEEGEKVEIVVDEALEDLDDALEQLAELDPKKAQLVELRYFGGFTAEETAELMGVSRATVIRQWRLTRVWLRDWMSPS